jgi:hypothetical protein
MEVARSEHPAVVLDEEIVVMGGLVEAAPGRVSATAGVEAYDPGSDIWRLLPEMPLPRHHLMAAVVGERLFAMGGFSESGFDAVSTVWELVGGVWEERAPLPTPVAAGAAVVLEGSIYIVGGTPSGGLFRYTPDLDAWQRLIGPAVEREHVAAVVHNGEIWVLAGRWQGEIFASTEIYDPRGDTWRHGPSLGEARSGFGATVLDDMIFVAGGEVFHPDQALDSVEILESGEWRAGESLPIGLHGNPLVAAGGALYLPGGSIRANGVDNQGSMRSLPGG